MPFSRNVLIGFAVVGFATLGSAAFFGVSAYSTKLREDRAASDPAILICEAVIAARLKAPSSYKRVSASFFNASVRISYDAVNSYNAPLRGTHSCEFARTGAGAFEFYRSGDAVEAEASMNALSSEMNRASTDGSASARMPEFRRKFAEAAKTTADTMALILTDVSAAKATRLQPIDPNQTSLHMEQ